MTAGFREEPGSFMGSVYMFKLLSSVDYNIRITVSSYDTIEAIVSRIADAAFRSRSLTKTNKREVYKLSERVQQKYINNAHANPAGMTVV